MNKTELLYQDLIKMLDDRNIMSHRYDSKKHLKVYNHLSLYPEQFLLLLENLKTLLNK